MPSDVDTFYQKCLEHPEGAPIAVFTALGWTNDRVVATGNALLADGRVNMLQGPQGIMWQAVSDEVQKQFAGLGQDQMLVYQLIKESGNVGIWQKNLTFKSNLATHVITKIIKTLETRKLIKAVKSIQARNRKVYMVYDMEPCKEVSGGNWYKDGEFDSELIEALQEQCLGYIMNQAQPASISSICNHIKTSGISQIAHSEDDIQSILRTLELDRLIMQQIRNGTTVYQVARPMTSQTLPVECIPCISCALAGECQEGGKINPQNCEYITAWFEACDEAMAG